METVAYQNGAGDQLRADASGDRPVSAMALPRALDLAFADELLAGILARAGDRTLTLDGSDVDYVSTPCVQILLAAGRKRNATNCSFLVRHASDAFRRAVDDFGLQPEFSKWMA